MSSATLVRPSIADPWGSDVSVDDDCEPVGRVVPRVKARAIDIESDPGVEAEFEFLADELEEAAVSVSSTRRLMGHPAYIGILALDERAIPLVLQRLRRNSQPIWLRLLSSLTAFQPGAGQENVANAAEEWIRWGKREGRIA
jgi:hypothetical protein